MLVALGDPDPVFQNKVNQVFRQEPDLKLLIVDADVITSLENSRPAVFLFTAFQNPQATIDFLDRVHHSRSSSKTVLLVQDENQDFFVRAVRAGCRGILHRDSAPDLLLKCIRKVSEGELWLDRATTAQVLRQFTEETPQFRSRERELKISPLSPREREIVSLVVQGWKNKELAEKLAISEQTVKNHMHNIFDKLGVSDRLELALYAIHHNLQSPESS